MKKLFLLTLLCPVLMGVALTSTSPSLVNEGVVEFNQDLAVYAEDETGIDSKLIGVKGAVVGDATVANSETYYQKGVREGTGYTLIRFATAVKGDLKTLSYDLTYDGSTQQVKVEKVYKAISVNGVTTYYGEEGMTTDETKSTYYWACFTLEFQSEAKINTRFYAKLNIVDSSGNESTTKVQSTSLGIMTEKYEVAFDGVMDDAIWTEAVKTNKWIARDDNVAKIEMFSTRTDKGIYFFANYEAGGNYKAATNWWQGYNFELTFMNEVDRYKNSHEVEIDSTSQYQFWASSFNNKTLHNFENGYVTPTAVYNESTAKYEVKFELFVSYAYFYAESNDVVGLGFGSNPGGNAWVAATGHASSELLTAKKISVDGIKDMLSVEECNHGYTDWTVTVPVTCGTDGERKRTCKACGYVDVEVIGFTGEHNWNYNDVTVTVPATCIAKGKGTVPCYANCGHTTEIELPIDENNHSQAWDSAAGQYPCCGERVQEGSPIINSVNNSAWGWGDVNKWTYIAKNLTGDYSVTIKYNTKTNLNTVTKKDVAAHTLVVVSEQLPAGVSGYGSCWVSRLDWWQWCDQWQSSERLTNELNNADGGGNGGIDLVNDVVWAPDFENDYKNTFVNCDITLTYSRTGTTLRNDYIIYSYATGKTYTYWNEIHNVPTTKNITLSLVCEQSTATISSIKYNNVSFAA